MNQLSVINRLGNIELTKGGIAQAAEEIVAFVIERNVTPLEALVNLKALEGVVKAAIDGISATAIDDAEGDYGRKAFDYLGTQAQVKETGVRYDYSLCNDPEYAALEERIATATEALKARAKYLQAVKPEGETILKEETGEVYTIYPPSKSSKTNLVITFKK